MTVGCIASAATNFDPHATTDDGSCVYNDGPVLRAAFRGSGWGGELHGWSADDNPCGGAEQSSWEGVTCGSSGRVTQVDLHGRSELGGFDLGPSLGNLTSLTNLKLCECPQISLELLL